MAPPLLLGLGLSLLCAAAEAQPKHDASALVQGSVHMHRAGEETVDDSGREVEEAAAGGSQGGAGEVTLSESVRETPEGPMAHTWFGAVRGLDRGTYNLFGGVPYAQTPRRFQPPESPKPWIPNVYDASKFRSACIGAGTGDPESEDCLNLNIWVPKGGHKKMPVIVYFHGGINQHGGGFEPIRRGDGITQSEKYPTIFINFDFRLGILGWISLPGSNISENLGLLDQQAALRWVHNNIHAFGGDPQRVTLQGQSEGSGIILVHMVAPGSQGLFQRAAFHSPVADFWSRTANRERTKFMIKRAGCDRKKAWSTLRCLERRKNADELWHMDWVSEELSRGQGTPRWTRNLFGLLSFAVAAKDKEEIIGQLGWHAAVDGKTVPEEPRELIRQGKFSKIPVLITVSRNESYGVIPNGQPDPINLGLMRLLGRGDQDRVLDLYNKSLAAQGIRVRDKADLMNQVLTDKLWTCDARALADDITAGGGRAHLGLFWHAPKYDFVGKLTSNVCEHGATCHAAEMLYILPQGEDHGIHGPGMEMELAFAKRYSDQFLAFVHGHDDRHPWKQWDMTRPMTFVDATGARVVPGYRAEQCAVLDRSMGDHLPPFMQRLAKQPLQ